MQLEIDEIYTFKLNSGEELVAKVKEIENGYVMIADPVSIGPGPTGGLGLVPSLFTYDTAKLVRLNNSNYGLLAHTDENVKAKYIEATTGIQVGSKKVLLG
jgi:hypothetical protein